MWSFAVKFPTKPPQLTRLPRLPRPQPDLVFGYSRSAFNRSQFEVSQLLVTKMGKHYALGKDYAMPDGNILFPFLVLECKAQAAGGTHFVATKASCKRRCSRHESYTGISPKNFSRGED